MRRPFASFRYGALALAAIVALPVAAQFRKPEAAIAYRRGAMTVMSAHFYRAAAMAYGRVPFDAKAVADNVEVATYLSKLPFAGFVEGSDKGNTEALPRIWTEMERFRALAAKMQEEMTKLNSIAKGGDLELIRGQVGVTEKACKTCHDAYTKE
jgi:cytochrome c556